MDTLAEFQRALDEAYFQLFITWDERNAALEKYRIKLREYRDEVREDTHHG